MRRPKPNKGLILDVVGSNNTLVEKVYQGLFEASLADVYPLLDLDEVVAFAASSWQARDKGDDQFRYHLEHSTLYTVFSHIYQIGMPWLNKHKSISAKWADKHQNMNPFNGDDLKGRLAEVDSGAEEQLRQRLLEPAHEYVFDKQYQGAKARRGGDNHRLEIYHFQNVYPPSRRKGQAHFQKMMREMIDRFASQVAAFLKEYPTNYTPR